MANRIVLTYKIDPSITLIDAIAYYNQLTAAAHNYSIAMERRFISYGLRFVQWNWRRLDANTIEAKVEFDQTIVTPNPQEDARIIGDASTDLIKDHFSKFVDQVYLVSAVNKVGAGGRGPSQFLPTGTPGIVAVIGILIGAIVILSLLR